MKNKPARRIHPVVFVPVSIPSNQAFLIQWHQWIHKQVAQMFRRDPERIMDTAQQVRQRLLSKDFIGRWFFKHLKDELVDKPTAELMLGRFDLTFLGSIKPVFGHRTREDSLWKVSDILAFVKFDHARYYYSPQNHTIDSDQVLRLIGYPPGHYEILASLYRQGKLWPSEFTEHQCAGRKKCAECARGRNSLFDRRVSLAHRWNDPSVRKEIQKLRWNDRQVVPFLRNWNKSNLLAATPQYIMRKSVGGKAPQGIEAGLLAYTAKFITNTVINEFKLMSRHDDTSRMVYNNGICPELADTDTVAFENDESEEKPQRVLYDPASSMQVMGFERRSDVVALIEKAGLNPEELDVIVNVDLKEMPVRQYAERLGKSVQSIHRSRASALRKLRAGATSESIAG